MSSAQWAEDPSTEAAIAVRAMLRRGRATAAEWEQLATCLGVRLVLHELGGVRAVLAPGLLFLAPDEPEP